MVALLVGSRATRYWFLDSRQPRDYDLFVDTNTLNCWLDDNQPHFSSVREQRPGKTVCRIKVGVQIEFETDLYKSVAELLDYSSQMPTINIFGITAHVASPEVLMGIKKSHLQWPLDWQKHIQDYTFLKKKNVIIPDRLAEIVDTRKAERAEREHKQAGSLNITNEEFFAKSAPALKRRFVHDDLHAAVKYYDEPLYAKAKNDQSLALLSESKFNAFTPLDKLRLVREESYVIALERIIIPRLYSKITLHRHGLLDVADINIPTTMIDGAYSHALQRICTTLTKGWFREFATEHYDELAKPEVDYFDLFIRAVIAGTLVEIDGQSK